MKKFIVALVLVAFPSWAQTPSLYVPPDEELWGQLKKALEDIPMAYSAHIQINNILDQVRQMASQKKLQEKLTKPPSAQQENSP